MPIVDAGLSEGDMISEQGLSAPFNSPILNENSWEWSDATRAEWADATDSDWDG